MRDFLCGVWAQAIVTASRRDGAEAPYPMRLRRAGAELVTSIQTKRSLGQAYTELGEETYQLIESGAITHPQLEAQADKIRALKTAEAEPVMAGAAAGASTSKSTNGRWRGDSTAVGRATVRDSLMAAPCL